MCAAPMFFYFNDPALRAAREKRKMRREAKSKAAQEVGEADVSSSSEDEVV